MPAKPVADELTRYLQNNPDPGYIDTFFADLCGVMRGKRYPFDEISTLLGDGVQMPGSSFMLTVAGENTDAKGLGFSDGDPDARAIAIPGSLQPVPWSDTPTAQLMLTLLDGKHQPYPFEPRNVLKKILAQLHELGVYPSVAFELEFYLVDHELTEDRTPQAPNSALTGQRQQSSQIYAMNKLEDFSDFFTEVIESCKTQGIQTSAISAEYAPAQYEINLHHHNDPLHAADQCIMFKRVVQSIARKHGFAATFMAKPYADLAGNGMHMHTSLYDKHGNNLFAGAGKTIASQMLEQAIAGIVELLPDSMAVIAPCVNSYRRFQAGQYVALSANWGYENRTAALRIPTSEPQARRIEHRLPGADANPYLALASIFAGIHYGITNKLTPNPASEGNNHETTAEKLPSRFSEALEKMANGKLKNYFGKDYVEAFIETKRFELKQFEQHIPPHEYDFYLLT